MTDKTFAPHPPTPASPLDAGAPETVTNEMGSQDQERSHPLFVLRLLSRCQPDPASDRTQSRLIRRMPSDANREIASRGSWVN